MESYKPCELWDSTACAPSTSSSAGEGSWKALGRWQFIFACPELLLFTKHLSLAADRVRDVSQMAILWFSRQQIELQEVFSFLFPEGMTWMTFAEAEEHTQLRGYVSVELHSVSAPEVLVTKLGFSKLLQSALLWSARVTS